MYKTTYCLILYLESYNDCLKSIVNFLTTLFLSSKAGNKSFNNFCLLIISSNFQLLISNSLNLILLISIFDFDFPFVVVADVINSIKIGINSVIFFLVNNDEFVLMVAMVSFSFFFFFFFFF